MKSFVWIFWSLLPCVVAALPRGDIKMVPSQVAIVDQTAWVNANQLLMFVGNNGSLAYDMGAHLGKNDGLYYPYVSLDDIINGYQTKTLMYSAGLWLGAIDSASGDTLVALSEYSTEFYPGQMINQTFDPNAADDPAVRVYRLFSDSLAGNPNYDYTVWPVSQAAPLDAGGNPEVIGDQTLWSVFNDACAGWHSNDAGGTLPLGVEVRQSAFAFNDYGELGVTVFIRYRFYNKGPNTLTGMRVALWADPDLGGSSDDLVGCDTNLSLGFAYNATNADAVYGSTPPAVGVALMQGPLTYTGNGADTAVAFGRRWIAYRNLGMTAFTKYQNGTDPNTYAESYDFMLGLLADGSPYMYNGDALTFMVSGSPNAGTGDLDFSPSDRRMMPSTGPFTMRPEDSAEIVFAIVVGQGADRLSSVNILRANTVTLREFFKQWYQPCCIGITGNVDGDAENIVDIADLMLLIDYLFFSGQLSICPEENNVDRLPSIDIGDLMTLIDYLFFSYDLPACP
ncbi:MAG: hypothetical protein AB1644_07135 [Candidatus Zixiibacteriota bacterium]